MSEIQNTLHSILDTLEDQVAVIDHLGDILFINKSWKEFFIENQVDLLDVSEGDNYFDCLQLQSPTMLDGMKDVLTNKTEEFALVYSSHGVEYERFFRIKINRCNLKEKDCGLIVLHREVTNEIHSEAIVVDVLDSMTDGFICLNKSWEITQLNRVAQNLLNIKNEDVLNRSIWDVYPEAIDSEFHIQYKRTMSEKIYITFESYFETLNSWFEIHSYPRSDGGISIYFKNINLQKESEIQKEVFENTDRLTLLPNRKAMSKKVDQAIKNGSSFSILYIDINGFKNINDMHGHEMGDAVLFKIAQLLKKLITTYGTLSHFGGDEFLVIIENKSRPVIEHIVDEMIHAFKQPIEIDVNHSFVVTVSIGISEFPLNRVNVNQLISAAETAMYHAKGPRHSHFRFYEVNMTEELSRRLTIEQSLHGDLSTEGIYFLLQPQLNGKTNEMVSFEVLSRWNHRELGQLSPLDFISVIENSGNMFKLTRYLMEEIFSTVSRWKDEFGFNKRVSINVTSSLLANELFFEDLYELLEKYALPYDYIELEITEETRLVTSTQMLNNIQKCREKGVRLAIDDFGTGFSMLSSLTHFPIDKIKVDKYFIQRIGNDSQSEAVLKSIIHLSKALHCDLVAEGVENEHEFQFLMEQGCHFFQGYYFEKPISIDDFQKTYIEK